MKSRFSKAKIVLLENKIAKKVQAGDVFVKQHVSETQHAPETRHAPEKQNMSEIQHAPDKHAASKKYEVGLLGADDSPRLSLVELKMPADAVVAKGAIHAKYHSVLAMEAARKMRRSRQKLRTGQQVCHHLRMMLASDPSPSEPAPLKQAAGAEPQFRLGF